MFNIQKKKKMAKNGGDILTVKGILERGYGINPKLIWEDGRLTLESKAILLYFWSFTGQGANTAFPSRKKILRDLKISKSRYYNHFKPLTEFGYVEVKQRLYPNGTFAGNIYILSQNVSIPNPDSGESGYFNESQPCPDFEDKPCPDFEDTNNIIEQYHVNIPPNPPKMGSESRKKKREKTSLERQKRVIDILNNTKIDNPKMLEAIQAWILNKEEMGKAITPTQLETLIKFVIRNMDKYGVDNCVEAIETSIANGWTGIVWDIAEKSSRNSSINANHAPAVRKNKFQNYKGRKWDYEDLAKKEQAYLANKNAEILKEKESKLVVSASENPELQSENDFKSKSIAKLQVAQNKMTDGRFQPSFV